MRSASAREIWVVSFVYSRRNVFGCGVCTGFRVRSVLYRIAMATESSNTLVFGVGKSYSTPCTATTIRWSWGPTGPVWLLVWFIGVGDLPLAAGSQDTAAWVSVALSAGGVAGVWVRLLHSCVGGWAPVI